MPPHRTHIRAPGTAPEDRAAHAPNRILSGLRSPESYPFRFFCCMNMAYVASP